MLLCSNVHQVVVHQARVRIVVFGVHEPEAVLHVERNRIKIGVHRQEPAASLVDSREHPFDVIKHSRSNLIALC